VLVDADPVRLAQIFTNLLINAAKYTNPGGHISLVTAQHEREAAVCIRDDGIGIPADKMEEIFELFSQAALGASSGAQGSELGWQCRGSWWSCTEAPLPRSEGAGHGREFVVRLPVGSPN
jgi:signal transduction histidine kinase